LEASGQLNGILGLPLGKIHVGLEVRKEKAHKAGVNTLGIAGVETWLPVFEIY
jgi:hypothetical protein